MYFEFFHQAPEFFVFFYTTKTFPLKLLHKISPLESLDRLQMHIYNRFDWETSQTQFSEQMKHTTQDNLEFPGYKKTKMQEIKCWCGVKKITTLKTRILKSILFIQEHICPLDLSPHVPTNLKQSDTLGQHPR